jgi:D-3-phosphoglycerate dehydrogenase
LRAGRWERSRFAGVELAGKTLGVIGLGRIGREVGRRAAGLDMKVLGFDPFLSAAGAAQLGIETAPNLDALLPRCDFITVHTPLTDETRGLIGARELEQMKSSAVLVNTARGAVIDQALREEPEIGFQTAAAFKEALEDAL